MHDARSTFSNPLDTRYSCSVEARDRGSWILGYAIGGSSGWDLGARACVGRGGRERLSLSLSHLLVVELSKRGLVRGIHDAAPVSMTPRAFASGLPRSAKTFTVFSRVSRSGGFIRGSGRGAV